MTADLIAQGTDVQMWISLALVAGVVVLYVTEWVSLELTSLGVLTVLLLVFTIAPVPLVGGVGEMNAERVLAGFANPALITVLALLVVGEALIRTGALDSVASLAAHPRLGRVAGLAFVLVGVGALSAFLNNTPVVVIFIPIIQALARQLDLSASRVMMPLSFIAILGGMTTLIGSSTNLLVSNTLSNMGEPRLSFFEFTVFGLILAVVGLAYVMFVLPRLLPSRRSLAAEMGRHGQQFISQIVVPEDSVLVGRRAVAGHFPELPDVTIRMIQRGEHAELPPFEEFTVQSGDILIIAAPRAALAEVAARHPGHLHPPAAGEAGADLVGARLKRTTARGEQAQENEQVLAEAMVPPTSRMVGLTLEQYGFHQRYNCIAIGILRRARMIRARMTDIRLEAGDVLLVTGHQKDLDKVRLERDLVVMSGTADILPARHKAGTAAAIFAVAVTFAATGILPIVIAALGAATLLIGIGAVNLRQAVRALDRKVVLVVAATLGLGEALYHTGGALYVAQAMLAFMEGAGPPAVLSGFFLLVALFTNILSNNACAVLFTPIGIGLAQQIGVDPRIFAITVVLAANCSFASPVGYQTNLLVMGPGQYGFTEFVKAGLPLVVVLWAVFSLVAPMMWAL